MKHTPGPWNAIGSFIVDSEAAAPALLAACRAAREALDKTIDFKREIYGAGTMGTFMEYGVIKQLDAAIRQAEGR